MATVSFKAKIETIYNVDDTVAYRRIKVPTITRRHCDMHAFRTHRKYGGFANSDLFASVLVRALKTAGVGGYLRLDALPDAVTVNEQAFLALVRIEL